MFGRLPLPLNKLYILIKKKCQQNVRKFDLNTGAWKKPIYLCSIHIFIFYTVYLLQICE